MVVRSDNGSGAFLFARSRRGLPIVWAYVRYTICRRARRGATGCIYSATLRTGRPREWWEGAVETTRAVLKSVTDAPNRIASIAALRSDARDRADRRPRRTRA